MRDITVYRCDVCDREIQLPRNRKGIETVGRCIITRNCQGRLYVEDIIQTTSPFLKPVDEVFGLQNFYPRNKLFNFSQRFEKSVWYINHNLETFPIISVYDSVGNTIPDTKFKVTPQGKNVVTLEFNTPTSGTAQLYVREISINEVEEIGIGDIVEKTQVSTSLLTGTVAFATTNPRKNLQSDTVLLELKTPGGQLEYVQMALSLTNSNSPWNGVRTVIIKNTTYYVGIGNFFSSGYNPSLISSGTTIKIAGGTSEVSHILLANEPFDRVDIITDKILKRDKINQTTNSLFFDNDQIFCNNAAISRVYPEIIVT